MKRLLFSLPFWLTIALVSSATADKSTSAWEPKKIPQPPKPTLIEAGSTNLSRITNFTGLAERAIITNRLNPEWLKMPSDPFTLGPGDKLELEILDDPKDSTTRAEVGVGPDGKIYYSMLSGLDVWGKTLTQTKEMIENEFTHYLKNKPQIGVTLRAIESKRIWLLGRFQAPGVYAISAPVTILEAIASAGGNLTIASSGTGGGQAVSVADNSEDLADLKHAFVVRNGELIPVDFEKLLKQGDLSQNIYLQANDFVYLPPLRAREIYVLGAVYSPRALPYQEGMTLVAAIAGGGGTFREEAYLRHVAIVRGSLAQPEIAIVDYQETINGHKPDITLEPHDIVYVPLKPTRFITRYAKLITNTFVTSLAINEGANSINNNIPNTGIVIPLGSTITITRPTTVQAR